jgi:hypothetical protein
VPFSRTSLAPLVFHSYLAKELSSEIKIIINNDKIIFVTIDTYIGDRTK